MFFPFMLFLLHGTVTSADDYCPEEKRVGDICYTKVAMTDTSPYGCMENCTYKKTFGIDSGLYCFKRGSLQVTQCGGETPYEIGGNLLVKCGSGVRALSCSQCGTTGAECEGNGNPDSECVLDSGKCVPRYNVTCGSGKEVHYCFECGKTPAECDSLQCTLDGEDMCIPRNIEFDLEPFMDSAVELLTEVETNTTSEIVSPSSGSCGTISKGICLLNFRKVLHGCFKKCKFNRKCWTSCLEKTFCNMPSICLPGGSCFSWLINQVKRIIPNPTIDAIIDWIFDHIKCSN